MLKTKEPHKIANNADAVADTEMDGARKHAGKLAKAKRHRLVASDIGRQSGVKPASRAAEYLSGRKTPHPDLANEMERVILQMVAEK